uniref:Condensin complex subunit 1 C-terminal domain-containing protein n=1 Tax=Globodera rostochiensis TaxID=31243 RepID=A0A914I1A3_GLORO
MAETATTVAPFVIPQRDDDLLQCSNTIYYVGELIQDEDEIRDAMKMFRLGVVQQGDFEQIAAHFDHFFPLVRTAADGGSAGTFDARLRVELAELLIKGLENLISSLQMDICDIAAAGTGAASATGTSATGNVSNNDNNDVEDMTPAGLNRRYSNCLLMHVYLLSGLINHFEQHMNKITRSAAAENAGCGRGKRKVVHVKAEADQIVQFWHKQDGRGKLAKVLYKLISLSVSTEDNAQFWRVEGVGGDATSSAIRFLWTSRQIDDSLKMCLLSMVCKFLENPDVCKAIGRTILNNMFMLLRHICIYWNMHKAVARALMDLAPRLDYFNAGQATTFPFVVAICGVQTDDELEPLLREMIAYGSKLDTAVDSGGTGGGRTTEATTRAFALFISTTVVEKPTLMHKHLAFIMPFLDTDPPMLRNAVLFACSEILLHCFDCKRLDQTMRNQRDLLFAHLTDHMMDKAPLVRTRVLNLWAKLASRPGAIPPVQLRLGLLWEARGRLLDNSMMVRKAAAALLTKLIRFNQFGADLHFDTFFVQFMNVRRHFATLYRTPTAVANGAGGDDDDGGGGVYAFEDAYAAVGDEQLLIEEDRADVQAVQRDRVRMELDQQLDALLFITEMEKALKQTLEYIRQADRREQAQPHEIAELLHFVCECVKFRLRDSMDALKRAFNLIWLNDSRIVELVTDIAHEALFSKNEMTLIARQRTAQNLVEAMRRATEQERISLEETVAHVFAKYGVHPKMLDEFWTYFDSADTGLRLSAARLIVVVAKAKHRMILPQLDRLYELYRNRTEHIRIEMLRVLMTLAAATKQKDWNTVLDTEQPSFRLDPKDKFVKLMSTFVFTDLNSQDANLWAPHCRQVVNVIYGACHRPSRVIKDLYDSILGKTKKCLDELRLQMHAGDGSDQQQRQSPTLGLQVEEMMTTTSPANNASGRAELELVISRLLFFVGELVLKFLSYAERTFGVYIKDAMLRQARQSATATSNRPPLHHSVREKNAENGGGGGDADDGDDDDDDFGLGQEISEEEKNQMCLQRVLDKDTFAQDTIIGRTIPVLMAVLDNHINWRNVVVESTLLCLSKFMLVNARCCKTFLATFFSFFDAASVRMRNNMIIMMADLSFRFPNVFNTFNDTFIQKVRDENSGVRYTCLLMCAHLLLKDQIKINACVADMAYCLLPDKNPSHIVTAAHGLFCEMGKKHNALYNNLPAIIDKLLVDVDASEQQEEDGEARVQEILQFLLQWLYNDQQKLEKLVDKLVERHGERVVGWRCVAPVLKAKEAALELQQQQLPQQPPRLQQQDRPTDR